MSSYYTFFRESPGEDESEMFYFYSPVTLRMYSLSFDPSFYAEFSEDFPALLSQSYSIGIYNKKTSDVDAAGEDPAVKETIIKIISTFLSNSHSDAVLLFHCDQTDDRQSARNVLFDRWYEQARDSHVETIREVIEIDVPSSDDEETIIKHYLGYMANKNNTNIEQVQAEFNTFCYNML